MARNFRREYDRYQGTPQQIKNRAERNAARAQLAKEGLVHKGDHLDVDHATPIVKGGGNARSNLRVKTDNENRSFARTRTGGMR